MLVMVLLQCMARCLQFHSWSDALCVPIDWQVYKRRDPASNEETELMENLFDCLCVALMHPANRQKFLDGEGPQLMILILK